MTQTTTTQYLIQMVTGDERIIDLAIVEEWDLEWSREHYRSQIAKGCSDYIRVVEA